MRKRIISHSAYGVRQPEQDWIDIARLAQAEITSEDSEHPIELALTSGDSTRWRAAQPGKQTIRIILDEPQRFNRIHLQFDEDTQTRTHEFVILWSSVGEQSYHENLRQQFTFSPPGTTREVEDYDVNLTGVKVLELRIVPDISKGNALASLTNLQIA
jgi:hypothetical protein